MSNCFWKWLYPFILLPDIYKHLFLTTFILFSYGISIWMKITFVACVGLVVCECIVRTPFLSLQRVSPGSYGFSSDWHFLRALLEFFLCSVHLTINELQMCSLALFSDWYILAISLVILGGNSVPLPVWGGRNLKGMMLPPLTLESLPFWAVKVTLQLFTHHLPSGILLFRPQSNEITAWGIRGSCFSYYLFLLANHFLKTLLKK